MDLREDRYDFDLLHSILTIKMAVDGSLEGWKHEEIRSKIKWLQSRLDEWQESCTSKDNDFDVHVKALLEISLSQYYEK